MFRRGLAMLRLSSAQFTDAAVNAASDAWRMAASRGHEWVTPEHLVAAMARSTYRPTRLTLARIGVDLRSASQDLPVPGGPVSSGTVKVRVGVSPETDALFSRARDLARGMGCPYVGTEHLILGILEAPSSPAGAFLRRAGASAATIRADLANAR